ncbi:MAG: Obg family GTPase CgtA, partial [Clostridiales bacterium]|nr:Obg family GTPase CgtA [Clostridiales bacterium]
KAPFKIDILDDGSFQVEGPGIERMIGYTSLESEKGFAFFQKYMVDKGVIAALEEAGAKEGDTVYVHGLTFDYIK